MTIFSPQKFHQKAKNPRKPGKRKKAYCLKFCCPKGAGALWHTLQSIFRRVQRCKIDPILGNTLYE